MVAARPELAGVDQREDLELAAVGAVAEPPASTSARTSN
jgi:hypothetical protein